MAGIDQQMAEVGRAATQLQFAASQLQTVASGLTDVLKKLSRSSSVQADAIDKGTNRLVSEFRLAATEIKSVADIINDGTMQHAIDKEREVFNKRLNNQSFFFGQEERMHAQNLRQMAQDIKDNEIASRKRLETLGDAYKKEIEQRDRAAKDRAELEQQTALRQKIINETQRRIALNKEAIEKAQIKSSIILGAADQAAEEEKRLRTVEMFEQQLAEEQQRLEEQTKLHNALTGELTATTEVLRRTAANIKNIEDETKQLTANITESHEAIDKIVSDLKTVDAKAAFKELFGKMGTALENSGYFGVAVGVKGIVTQIQTGINRSVGMLDVGQQAQVSQLNMSPTEFQEMTGEYRRGMLAAGGMTNSLNTLSATAEQLEGNVASRAEAAKFAAQQMEMFANMGVRPTTDRVRAMGETFKSIHAVTGMTLEEFNTSMRDIMENEESMYQMRLATTEAERIAIADSVAARYKENRLRGISDEQTRAMLKKQMEMQNQKPKSRFQQAVKQAALAGAMGIGGGDEMIRLVMKPASQHTDEERRRYQEFQDRLNQVVMGGLGSSNFGTQLYTEALADKTGYDERGMAVFNTAQARAAMGNPQAAAGTMGQVGEIGKTVNEAIERGLGILKNPIIQLAGGILLLLPVMAGHAAAMVAHTTALWKSSKLGGGTGQLNRPMPDGNAPDGGKGDRTRGRGRLGRIADGLKRAGPGLLKGGVATIGGMALSGAGSMATEAGYEKTGATLDVAGSAASGAGVGAMIGSVVPGVGTAIGAGVGGVLGGAYGLYQNWGTMFGGDKNPEQQPTAQVKPQVDQAQLEQLQNEFKQVQTQFKSLQEENAVLKQTIEESQKQPTPVVAPQGTTAGSSLLTAMGPLGLGAGLMMGSFAALRDGMLKTPTEQKKTEEDQRVGEEDPEKLTIAQTIENQIKHLTVATEANNYLKTVADNVPTLVDLANRQLIAMTLTDKEKERNRDSVRKSSGLAAASFQYL